MGALSSLLPLVVLSVVIAGAGFVGYQIYLWSNELADRGQKHMEKKNMNFTKDGGLRVGVKQMGAEEYADRTQRVLVNTWNESRPGSSRTASGSSRPATGRTSSAGLQAPEHRASAKRSSSPVPGGW